MIETKGYLDSVVLEADVLRLDGWAAALDAGSIDKFNLTCGGKGLFNNEVKVCASKPGCEVAPSGSRRFRPLLPDPCA